MSTMVLDSAAQQRELSSLTGAFEQAAKKEGSNPVEIEKKLDDFLDQVNEDKRLMRASVDELRAPLQEVERVAWVLEINANSLPIVERLVIAFTQLTDNMRVHYEAVNTVFESQGIDRAELDAYKEMVYNIQELTSDLIERFFAIPQDDEFQSLMKELSEL